MAQHFTSMCVLFIIILIIITTTSVNYLRVSCDTWLCS